MTIEMIRYFIEAAACEHFTQAAQNLFIPQPHLSRQISKLEEEVGCILFVRERRGVRLTESGRHLYEELKDIPALIDSACNTARGYAQNQQSISVGVLQGQLLNNAMAFLQTKYPAIHFEFEVRSFKDIRNGLQNRYYDLIITLSFDIEGLERIQSIPIPDNSESVIAVNSVHLKSLSHADFIPYLRDETCIVISPKESPIGYQRTMDQYEAMGFRPKQIICVDSIDEQLLYIEANRGYTLLDRRTILQRIPYITCIPCKNIWADSTGLCVAWRTNVMKKKVPEIAQNLAQYLLDQNH